MWYLTIKLDLDISFEPRWMAVGFPNMVHLCNALDLKARKCTLSEGMNLPATEVLISEAMRKIKSRFNEVDFYLGWSGLNYERISTSSSQFGV